MRSKEEGLYRENGREDEGTLRSERSTVKKVARVPTNINDPRLACQSMHASQQTNQTVTPRVRPKEVMNP